MVPIAIIALFGASIRPRNIAQTAVNCFMRAHIAIVNIFVYYPRLAVLIHTLEYEHWGASFLLNFGQDWVFDELVNQK
jgi:hypothetical protein